MRIPIFCLLCVSCLLAQNAQVSGLVKDASDAVVVNAAVTVVNKDTGAERAAKTNAEGLYSVPALSPGRYEIRAAAVGFRTESRDDVILEVAQNARLDFVLEVGALGQSVTVSADALPINVTDGSVGMSVTPDMVANLPLNGRSFQQLFTLTPGVTLAPASSSGQFVVDGQRATANYVTVDGVSANTGAFGNGAIGAGSAVAGGTAMSANAAGGTNSLVSVDALQEFRILTNSYAPEYGRTPGGQMILLTRSGTNAFHASVFEYFRNDKLDATNWFVNQQGKTKPPLRVNNFGGTLGGPVVRNRTFFFFSYEGERLRQPQFGISVVPSVASRQSAPPATQGILSAFPVPNGPDLGSGQAQFAAGYSNPITTDSTSLRVDQVFGPKLTAFGRYSYAPSSSLSRPGGNIALSVTANHPNRNQTLTTGATYILSSRAVMEGRLNFTDDRFSLLYNVDNFGGAGEVPPSAFPAPLSPTAGLIQINLNFTGGTLWKGVSAGNEQRQINLVDTVTYTVRSHQLKFGVDYRRLLPLSPVQNAMGYGFAGIPAVIQNVISSFVLGYEGRVVGDITNLSLYTQDNWHMTGRLTLTYGVRWDLNPPPRDRDPNNGNYTPLLGNFADLSTLHPGTPGSALWNTQYKNFAPRLGAAYQLWRKSGWETVLRSGFGLFYDLGNGGAAINPWTAAFPNNLHVNLARVSFPLSPGQIALPPVNLTNPPANQQFFDFPPNFAAPRSWQWNAAVQQALGHAQTLTVSYVAALGRDLVFNQQYPLLTAKQYTVNYATNDAASSYQSLQALFQRRLSRGLAASAAYTWSHSIDTSSGDNEAVVPTTYQGSNRNRGNSAFDLRHNFSSAFTYDLPGKAQSTWLRALTRGWGLDGVIVARSALPLNITSARDIGFGSFALRPNLAPGVPVYIDNPNVAGGKQLNRAAFVVPTTQQGGLGRNTLRGFGMWQADLSGRRSLRLRERYRLTFRADMFNILNHPNFANPVGDLGSGLFGQSTSMLNGAIGGGANFGLNSLFQVGGPRSVQLSLRLQF